MYSTVMHINDFPRPTSTLTRPLCILMIFLDLPRHLLDSNPANSQHTILLTHKMTFWSTNYLACVVYTKTIIHLSVGESDGYLPPLR